MISKKLQKLKPSATQTIASQVKALKAQGEDVINLSAGEPPWDNFEWTKEQAILAIQKGNSGYSPASGRADLKVSIAQNVNQHLKLDYSPNQVTVSIGAKYICFSALQALTNPDDEVLVPAPYWVSYPSMVDMVGAKIRIVETDLKTHKLTAPILQKHLNQKSRVLILNSPNNPTGAVYSLEELKAIGEVLKKWKSVYVLSDDIYNRMALDFPKEAFAPHLLQACPELKDRVLVVNAASKNYAMPGWRLGWAVGEETLIKAMSAFQSQTVSCAPTIAQVTMTSTFAQTEVDLQNIHSLLCQKRDKCTQLLKTLSGISFNNPEGAFYIWLDVRSLYHKKYKNQVITSSLDVFRILSSDYALFAVPGEEFGRSGFLRIHFAVSDADIEKCKKRLNDFISQLQN